MLIARTPPSYRGRSLRTFHQRAEHKAVYTRFHHTQAFPDIAIIHHAMVSYDQSSVHVPLATSPRGAPLEEA